MADPLYASSSQTATYQSSPAAATTVLGPSANPSSFGQPVTLIAPVNPSAVSNVGTGTLVPTGAVGFSDGSSLLGSGTLSTSGGVTTATFATNTLATGSHNVTARYAGDGNFTTSNGSLTQTVTPAGTTTGVSYTLDPTKVSQSVVVGGTVAVVAPGTTAVSGFSGTLTVFDGATAIGQGPVSASGQVTVTVTLTATDGGSGIAPSGAASVVVTPVAVVPIAWTTGDDQDDHRTVDPQRNHSFDPQRNHSFDPPAPPHGDPRGNPLNAQLRTYQISDRAGNTLTLVVKVYPQANGVQARVISLQYNGGPVRTALRNALDLGWLSWPLTGPNAKLLGMEQRFQVGADSRPAANETDLQVVADYNAFQNQSIVRVLEPDRGPTTTVAGLDLLSLVTSQGHLTITH